LNASSVRIAEAPTRFYWIGASVRNATLLNATPRYVDRKLPNNIAQ